MRKRTIALAALAALSLSACTRVTPGNVGVRVNQQGSDAGVEPTPLGVGTYMTGLFTSIYEYPISTQSYTWTASKEEGKEVNEEFSFQDRSGLIVTGDVSISYHVDPAKAPVLFQKYRMEMDSIIAGPLRNQVRSAIVNVASQMSVEDIYGPKKADLINAAERQVQQYFASKGLVVESMYWAGPIRIPASILNQINAKIKNEQEALAAQANVATVKANAEAATAQAQGEADATKVKAIAEAEAMRIKAAAIAQSPKLIGYEWVQKWDGAMPKTVYCTSAQPCVQGNQ